MLYEIGNERVRAGGVERRIGQRQDVFGRADGESLDLANLCVNARDAIQGVGRVTIETGNDGCSINLCIVLECQKARFLPESIAAEALSRLG